MRGFKHGNIIFEWCEKWIWDFEPDEDALNGCLISAYKFFDIKIPWEGDFDSFMGNSSNRLVFE